MIDWEKIAKANNLTIQELEKEILTVCSVMGAMQIDAHSGFDALRFTCSDDTGKIELTVKRVEG